MSSTDDNRNEGTTPDIAAVLAAAGGSARQSRRGKYVAASLLALVLAGGAYAWYASSSSSSYRYTTVPVERGDLNVIVTATGSVQPTTQVDISSELSGIIRSVNVTYNSPVKTNDVLAELDTNKLEADVQSARAKLASAKANVLKADAELSAAKVKLDRLRSLVDSRVSSQQDLDAAQYAYDAALATRQINEATVLSSEADLKLAEVDLGKAKIVSPIDGVVLTRDVDPGATVASSFSAPVLFTIAGDLRQMELQVAVDEADVGQVEAGQKATFNVDAYPDRSFPAEIETVRFASETTSNVITYKAILSVDNEDMLLRPGMTATADITVQSVEDVLLIPNAALRYSPPAVSSSSGISLNALFRPPRPSRAGRSAQSGAGSADERTVWVMRGNQPEPVDVQTGPTDGRNTVLRSGDLKEGDLLITDATAVSS
ncbi:efflux RND transporter periplasmic adaptor subunit [Rhizobiaceae bacterium BDR2-2]|uniref:Efflux RND transporter periplasmic adaptor subunit n=1 Tax=Ectorhizobium quercum TaxID=2965071 RepID=A0AAE3MZ22_9HYPH|nr:efflux RND transporter periplasmic adaptor subunit [Ectorhizobium quercum]MCX8997678.1 efflux RND transporter periplasmic adaptor subunit [Ectorhizobium quercum]